MKLHLSLAGLVIAFATIQMAQAADDEAETKSVLYCAAPTSDFRIAFAATPSTVPKGYGTAETFNASVLTKWSKDPTKAEDARRTGSRVKHLHCGDVTIDVRVGFYNGNPQGELGAADDFARLTIIRGAKKLEVSLLEDSCSDASIPRAQAAWGDHPLQAIEGHKMGAVYQLTLFKTVCGANGSTVPVSDTLAWP
jgi:hypothetical protein